MPYFAQKPCKVGDEIRPPGSPLPEAATWGRALRALLLRGVVVEIPEVALDGEALASYKEAESEALASAAIAAEARASGMRTQEYIAATVEAEASGLSLSAYLSAGPPSEEPASTPSEASNAVSSDGDDGSEGDDGSDGSGGPGSAAVDAEVLAGLSMTETEEQQHG